MQTEKIYLDEKEPDEEGLERAAAVIAGGGLVAFPTETVYGLGADAMNADAAKRIYEAKGRPSDNPLIVHIAEAGQLSEVAREIPEEARRLAERFWPGPLTMVLKKNRRIPEETTGGLDTVAVRCPSNVIARELILRSRRLIAAPSANRSGRPSTTKFTHVVEDLDGRIDMIIDGGDAVIGLESTIVDLTGQTPVVLRPGYITRKDLESVLGRVEMDPAAEGDPRAEDFRPKAPGMKYRHYAPKGELFLVKGSSGNVVRYINKLTREAVEQGRMVGVIATSENKERYRYGMVVDIGSRENDKEIASGLYDALRKFDTMDAEVIYAEYPAGDGLAEAIANRMLKAAAYSVIEAPAPLQSSRRRRIIFVEGHGNARSAMAAALFERLYEGSDVEVLCRGIIVQFPEPLNQKTEAVMVSNGMAVEGFVSKELTDSEIRQDTMIFVMEERQRSRVIARFPSATEDNVFLLSAYVGDELEIMDPYGGTLQTYGICFEVLRQTVQKLSDRILEEKTYG